MIKIILETLFPSDARVHNDIMSKLSTEQYEVFSKKYGVTDSLCPSRTGDYAPLPDGQKEDRS